MTMEFTTTTLVVPVSDWRKGLQWYQQAFPTAVLIDVPEHDFQLLKIGELKVEIAENDAINPVEVFTGLIHGARTHRHEPKVHASSENQGVSRNTARFLERWIY